MIQQFEGREPSKSFAPGNGRNATLSVSRHLHSKQEVALAVGGFTSNDR